MKYTCHLIILITVLCLIVGCTNIKPSDSSESFDSNHSIENESGYNESVNDEKEFAIGEKTSEYFTFEELLKLSTDIIVGEFVKQYKSDFYTVYEFSVITRLLGEGSSEVIHVYEDGFNCYIPEKGISFNSELTQYIVGEQYLLITERSVSVYNEHDKYLVLGGLYFPLGSLSDSKVYGQSVSEHTKAFNTDLNNDSASLEALLDFIKSEIRGNTTKPSGIEYIEQTQMSDVLELSTYVVKIKLESIKIDTTARSTYNCTIINDYKNNLCQKSICVVFNKGTVQTGETYIVALEALNDNMVYFVLSSKNSMWSVEEESLIVSVLKE